MIDEPKHFLYICLKIYTPVVLVEYLYSCQVCRTSVIFPFANMHTSHILFSANANDRA